MLFLLNYALKRIYRDKWKCLFLFAATFCLMYFMLVFTGAKIQQRLKYDEYYETVKIDMQVSDILGSNVETLRLGVPHVTSFVGEKGALRSYVKDVWLRRHVYIYSIDYALRDKPISFSDNNVYDNPHLIGVTSLLSEKVFDEEIGGTYKFFDGWDESDLYSDEKVCLVSEALVKRLSLEPFDKIVLTTECEPQDGQRTGHVVTQMTVIGTHAGADMNTIYAPWSTVNTIGMKTDGSNYTDILSATLLENNLLNEMKELIRSQGFFGRVDVNAEETGYAIAIDDGQFIKSVSMAQQNIIFYDMITPFVFVLAVSIGFLTSFLYTRGRVTEFAVMRSIGVGGVKTALEAFSEQLILGLLSSILAVVVTMLTQDVPIELFEPSMFLLCFSAGTLITIIKVSTANALEIMKARE